MRKFIASCVLLSFLGLACSGAVLARDKSPFITAKEIDLSILLAPPPANDSPKGGKELAEVLKWQVTRTPEMVERARADTEENVWRFADVMGPKFTAAQLPTTARFFQRLVDTEDAVVDPSKKVWKRPRPQMYSELVKPAVKLSTSGSYPSGHATDGTLMAIMLSNMVPEKRIEIWARGIEYGNNRVIGGIHFPSDVEAGRITGSIIAGRLLAQDDFVTSFNAAKSELRGVLGLDARNTVLAH
jgi:acid phosphatase (class A)